MLLELRHRLVAYSVMCARLRFLSGVGFYGRDKSALDGSLVSSKHTPISGLKQAHSNVWFQASTLQSLVSSKHSTLQANCLFHISANVLPFCNAQALHAAESKHPAKFYEQSEMKINWSLLLLMTMLFLMLLFLMFLTNTPGWGWTGRHVSTVCSVKWLLIQW